MNEIGNNIANLRKERNLSQRELGDMLNVGQATISSWEKGRTEPNMGNIAVLSQKLGCTLSEIVGSNDPVASLAIETERMKRLNSVIKDFNSMQFEQLFKYACFLRDND